VTYDCFFNFMIFQQSMSCGILLGERPLCHKCVLKCDIRLVLVLNWTTSQESLSPGILLDERTMFNVCDYVHVTNESCRACNTHTPGSERGLARMGWLRLVGSLKVKGSFAKEPYNMSHISIRHVTCMSESWYTHEVATISRLLKIIGLFCRISSLL